jgi:hypothetical protein
MPQEPQFIGSLCTSPQAGLVSELDSRPESELLSVASAAVVAVVASEVVSAFVDASEEPAVPSVDDAVVDSALVVVAGLVLVASGSLASMQAGDNDTTSAEASARIEWGGDVLGVISPMSPERASGLSAVACGWNDGVAAVTIPAGSTDPPAEGRPILQVSRRRDGVVVARGRRWDLEIAASSHPDRLERDRPQSAADACFVEQQVDERIYLLLEHQSTADPRMPLRMLGYMMRIWERCLADTPSASLPAIVAVVVAHGGYVDRMPMRMHELVHPEPATIPGLAELVPAFRIIVDDIGAATDAQLRGRALAAFPMLALWLLRDARRGDVLLRRLHAWADAFRAVARAPGGIAAMHRLMRYVEAVLGERRAERFQQFRGIVASLSSQTEKAVVLYSDRVRAEGVVEGRIESTRQILLKLLALRYGPIDERLAVRIREADLAQLGVWIERFAVATELDAIFSP